MKPLTKAQIKFLRAIEHESKQASWQNGRVWSQFVRSTIATGLSLEARGMCKISECGSFAFWTCTYTITPSGRSALAALEGKE